jgi:Fur family ferric uptake transcriptional regulator
MSTEEEILEKYNLKKTNFRLTLIKLFQNSNSSLTAEEIQEKIKSTSDKVTIYRALSAFEKKCLIHRVPDKSNLIRYALCQKECFQINHKHNHAHFICNICAKTFCLENIKLPKINITSGFKINKTLLTLEGSCENCN